MRAANRAPVSCPLILVKNNLSIPIGGDLSFVYALQKGALFVDGSRIPETEPSVFIPDFMIPYPIIDEFGRREGDFSGIRWDRKYPQGRIWGGVK
jgi:hypothetical protein